MGLVFPASRISSPLADEANLVLIASVGALLHLDHLDLLQHLEAVAAGGEQDDIASLQRLSR